MENLGGVPLIVAIVYGTLVIYKKIVGEREKLIRIIPIIATVLGMALGVLTFYAYPDIMLADDVFTAILIGASSGLAATGTNQIFKQLTKKEDTVETETATSTSQSETEIAA